MSSDFRSERVKELLFTEDALSRIDESDDAHYYARERFVQHLDSLALKSVERIIGTLVVEPRPVILDLMASWDSHIPEDIEPAQVVGLGLNPRELKKNTSLQSSVVHDLNRNPKLPFEDASFDVVLNTVSVEYLVRPLKVFSEVQRVLRPGGLFLILFSNRMFKDKAIKLWRQASEEERLMFVEDLFRYTPGFEKAKVFVSQGKPRPLDDKYSRTGLPSDPVYAVYAETRGGEPEMSRPDLWTSLDAAETSRELKQREAEVPYHHRCPHCQRVMSKWRVPENPFTEWDTDHLYICFNDECAYFVRGWDVMASQGNLGFSYRMMYNPASGGLGPVPVTSLRALRDGIIKEHDSSRPSAIPD